MTDLKRLQQNYFDAMRTNLTGANDVVLKTQNWLLVLALGELAFFGQILTTTEPVELFYKISTAILLLSFIAFIIGSVIQFKHVLKEGRRYHKLSKDVTEYMKTTATVEVENLPSFLNDNDNSTASSRWANKMIALSFILVLGITSALIVKVLYA